MNKRKYREEWIKLNIKFVEIRKKEFRLSELKEFHNYEERERGKDNLKDCVHREKCTAEIKKETEEISK